MTFIHIKPPTQGWCRRAVQVLRAGVLGVCGLAAALPSAHAEFQNGGFEQDFTGWTTQSMGRPSSNMTPFPPTKYQDLGLTPRTDGSVSAVLGSTADAKTGGKLATPLFGIKSARVGDDQTGNRGAVMRQTATLGVGDIDPADGKVHVRFAIAPVLSDGGHLGPRQPFFFVEVKNLTKGTQLFYTFNFAGETGVPWQQGSVGQYKYTHWQAIDIGPGAGVLDVGDQVEVIISSAGCADGGHAGYVYVDSGQGLTTLPGPFVTATGPQYAVRSSSGPVVERTVAYNYHYSNTGDAPMPNSQVVISSPQDQKKTSAPTRNQQNLRVDPTSVPGSCSVATIPPAHFDGSMGPLDRVTCDVGTLNPGNAGDLQLRWIVPEDAEGPTINHGDYDIRSASSPPLLGPLVRTTLTTLMLADLKASVTNADTALACGATTSYTVTLDNAGADTAPIGVAISNTVPAGLTVTGWTCSATGNATLACPAASGTGSIAGTTGTAWPLGDKLTYTVNATVDACSGGPLLITYPVSVALPASDTTIVDPMSANNTSAHVLNAGTALQPLTVDSSGAGQGTVTSVLPGIMCNKNSAAQCTDTKQFPGGSQVALYANAPTGSIFSGWSGAGCTGTAQPCLVTMDQARSVTATFSLPLAVTVNVTTPGGSVAPGNGTVVPVASGGTTSLTVTPDAGYAPVFGGSCPAGSFVGNTYTTGAIAADCAVDVSFTNAGVVTATPSVTGPGSVTGGPKTVTPGGSASWVVVPNSGSVVGTPAGTCPAGTWSGNVYTITPLNASCTVNFPFAAAPTPVAVTSSVVGGNGTVSPTSTSVMSGSPVTFTLVPDPGYEVNVAGTSTTCTGGAWSAGNTVYTVPSVAGACSLTARFLQSSYTVTASEGANPDKGTVGPASQTLTYGQPAVFNVSALQPGWSASVNAGSTCPAGSFSADRLTYTVPAIVGSCAVVFDYLLTTTHAIPTLSEWGMIILTALMALVFVGARRRQMR